MRKVAKDLGKIVLGLTVSFGCMKILDKTVYQMESPEYWNNDFSYRLATLGKFIASEFIGLAGGATFFAGMLPLASSYQNRREQQELSS